MQNNIKVGSVVKCTAGHDSGNYFVVIISFLCLSDICPTANVLAASLCQPL